MFIITKKRKTGEIYHVRVLDHVELVHHIQGCYNNTDHIILSIINVGPFHSRKKKEIKERDTYDYPCSKGD